MMQRRSIAVMGDGGFWHNGLLTGVQAALFNGDDAVPVIMKNGYTSATGTQDILNTPDDEAKAEGACQLERQRRIRPWTVGRLQRGQRVQRVKYGVDEDVCTGDHACIRLSGCPTLALKDNPDPLRVGPVATVIDGGVGCGLCGANAHAATLCPSFYRAEVVTHPGLVERLLAGWRQALTGWLRPA